MAVSIPGGESLSLTGENLSLHFGEAEVDEQGFQNPNTWLEMLSNLGINDPKVRMIAEMMEKQRNASATGASLAQKLERRREALARIEKLSQENSELREENQLLRERLEILAESLGACPECWGEDPSCRVCEGQGSPGRFVPNRDAFSAYVIPAVRTIHRYTPRTKASREAIKKEQSDSERKDVVD